MGVVAGCTPAPPGAEINDPFEETNRAVHGFNKDLDRVLLRPAGQAAAGLPMEIREPASNFADNVGLPGMVLNGLLQGDIGGASTNTFRFLLNTTIGIGGLFDPAGAIGLGEETTDFGETLAVWGVQEGAYVELPVFGPSTERDAAGRIVDLVIDPFKSVGTPAQRDYASRARLANVIIDRARFSDTIDSVLYDSADSYAQARLLYLQNRRFQLGEDASGPDIDPYADDLDLEGFE